MVNALMAAGLVVLAFLLVVVLPLQYSRWRKRYRYARAYGASRKVAVKRAWW